MLKQNRQAISETPTEMGVRPLTNKENKMINKHLKTKGKTVIIAKDPVMKCDVKQSKYVKVVKL